jgi:hypothetical protein
LRCDVELSPTPFIAEISPGKTEDFVRTVFASKKRLEMTIGACPVHMGHSSSWQLSQLGSRCMGEYSCMRRYLFFARVRLFL